MVRSLKARAGQVEIGVEVQKEAWLVVSQSAVRGWRASGDGDSLETGIADGTLLAVRVPAGTQKIVLGYLPGSFLVGGVCSLVCLLGFVGLGLKLRGARAPGEG
jgi:uncharacterized membrane protein YfhO